MFQACFARTIKERAERAIESRKLKWESGGLMHRSYDIDDQLISYKTNTLLSEDIIKRELDPLKSMNIRLYKEQLQNYPGDDEAKQLIDKSFKKAQKLILSAEYSATKIFKKQLVTLELDPSNMVEFNRRKEWAMKTAHTKYDLKQVKRAARSARPNKTVAIFANDGYERAINIGSVTQDKITKEYQNLYQELDPKLM